MTAILRLYLCTWNVGEQETLSEGWDQLLGFNAEYWPDVYGIGLQEKIKGVTSALYEDEWTTKLTDYVAERGYCRVKVVSMQGMVLMLFVKRCHLPFVTNVESEYTGTGIGGVWGNKGGLSIRADLYGVNFIVVNCHLAAHLNSVDERIIDYQDIIESQSFSDPETKNILDHDYVFWMGDLNFRIDDVDIDEIKDKIKQKDFKSLWPHDQLLKAMSEERLLIDFEEGQLDFAPSYKFDPGTDTYDTSAKNRKPAWCDRILWMVHEDSFENICLDVKQISYTSLPQFKTSDHKPVMSLFDIKVLRTPSLPDVTFRNIYQWLIEEDARCYYQVKNGAETSKWDWIGLYRVDFRHLRDYVTYEYAKREESGKEMSVKFSDRQLKVPPGRYCLCYVNGDKDFVRGMTNVFEIVPALEESDESSSSTECPFEETLSAEDTDDELEAINRELRERRIYSEDKDEVTGQTQC